MVTSPFITWTYTLLMDVAARAEPPVDRRAAALPGGLVASTTQSAQLIWVMYWASCSCLYDNLQAKLAIPVVLAVAGARRLHLQPHTELGFLNSLQVLLTLNLAATLYFLENARLLSRAGGNAHWSLAWAMSLSASIVLSGIIIYTVHH